MWNTLIDEIKHVSMQESCGLYIPIYATAAVRYYVEKVDEMKARWNSICFQKEFWFS
jgi:hypothetical protein